MTVKELIENLKAWPKNWEVVVCSEEDWDGHRPHIVVQEGRVILA